MAIEMIDNFDMGTQIKVIGVGGGGGNAVEHMISESVQGVQFICANTDSQALNRSSAEVLLQLGNSGLGAGAKPEAGKAAAEEAVDHIRNALVAVQGHDHPWLQSHSLVFDDASWVAGTPPADGALPAKARYRQADATCRLAALGQGRFSLQFDAAQWAVTPGQSAVLYDGEVCLGGGVIASAGAGT